MTKNDVLIIGSGIGGISIAIILAKLGYQVTIIEKNRLPGGLMRSYTRKGIECPVGVHYLGSLDNGQILRRFFDYMGVTSEIPVERMGTDGVIDKYFFDSINFNRSDIPSNVFDLPEGFDAFERNLRSTFPDEQHQITSIMDNLRYVAKKIHQLEILFSKKIDASILELSKPFGKILTELKCSPGLRAVLGVPCSWIGVPLESCPSFYHHIVLATYLFSSWRLKCSGSEMADAFVKRFKSLGGKILPGSEVKKVRINSRIVEGIQLKSGEILRAPIVIGAIHPKMLLEMLPKGATRPSYRKRILQLENTIGILGLVVEVDAISHKEIPYNIFKVDTDKYGKITDIKFYQIKKIKKTGKNILSILIPNKFELWKRWENTVSGHRGDDYLDIKRKKALKLITEAEEIFGAFHKVNLIDIYTPLTIRDWANSPNGSAYGVLRSSQQLLSAELVNRTNVKGLFLAGQNAKAPGIIGAIIGSFSTVKLIIGPDEFEKRISL